MKTLIFLLALVANLIAAAPAVAECRFCDEQRSYQIASISIPQHVWRSERQSTWRGMSDRSSTTRVEQRELRTPALSKRERTMRLQRQLRDAGFNPGPIDGRMGPKTRRALRLFERQGSKVSVTVRTKTTRVQATVRPAHHVSTTPPFTPPSAELTDTIATNHRSALAVRLSEVALGSVDKVETRGYLGCAEGASKVLRITLAPYGIRVPIFSTIEDLFAWMRRSGLFEFAPLDTPDKLGCVVLSTTSRPEEGHFGHIGFSVDAHGDTLVSNNNELATMWVNQGKMETLPRWIKFQRKKGNPTYLLRPRFPFERSVYTEFLRT